MKSMYRNMMLVAAAAMSLASCSKDAAEELAAPAPEAQTKTITVTADVTRIQFGGDRTQLAWSASDQFGVYTDVDTDRNIWSGNYSAAVNGAFSLKVNADATEVYAYYPYYGSQTAGNTAVNFGIPVTQTWEGPGVLSGTCLPMVASGAIEGSNVNLTFEQLGCVLALNVYGGKSGETLSSVTFTADEGSCGYADVDITADPVVFSPAVKKVTLNPETNAEAVAVDAAAVDNQQNYPNQIYLVVDKKEYAAGARFVVKTSANSDEGYTFTTRNVLDCSNSDFMAINLNLKNEETPEPSGIPEGDYLVLAHSSDSSPEYYAMSMENSERDEYRRAFVEFEYNGTDEKVITDNQMIVWHIAKGTDGYTFATTYGETKYLAYTSSGARAKLSDTAEELTVTDNGDGTYTVVSKQEENRRLSLNPTYGFGFYGSTTGTGKVYLVPAEMGVVERCIIDTFSVDWTDGTQTAVEFSGTYTSTYATAPTWSLTVSKDGGEEETIEVLAEEGVIVANDYTVNGDGSYVFTLTATVNGQAVATETARITKGAGLSEYTAVLTREDINNGQSWSSYLNQTASVTGSDNKTYTIELDYVAYNKDYIQIRKSKSSAIYNTTDLGNITSIVIEDKTGATYTVKVGSSQKPTTTEIAGDTASRVFEVSNMGNGYFHITNANTTISNITKITIKYMN